MLTDFFKSINNNLITPIIDFFDWHGTWLVFMMCVVTITFVMGVIGSFFEFGWAAFFASIFSIIATILGFILCAMFDDAFGTLNPYRIYIKLFWHKITFDGRTVLPETIEDWLTFNCTGRWKKGSRYLEYYLSKKEDAVHTKLVW